MSFRPPMPVLAICASFRASLNWQFRWIDHNGSHNPYLFFLLSNCAYNSHIIKNENFLAYFIRTLNSCIYFTSFKLSTLGFRHPSRIPSDRQLFDETFAQPCIFAVMKCADVALSVFYYYSVSTRCRIFL